MEAVVAKSLLFFFKNAFQKGLYTYMMTKSTQGYVNSFLEGYSILTLVHQDEILWEAYLSTMGFL